jgi:hypothetical protein
MLSRLQQRIISPRTKVYVLILTTERLPRLLLFKLAPFLSLSLYQKHKNENRCISLCGLIYNKYSCRSHHFIVFILFRSFEVVNIILMSMGAAIRRWFDAGFFVYVVPIMILALVTKQKRNQQRGPKRKWITCVNVNFILLNISVNQLQLTTC